MKIKVEPYLMKKGNRVAKAAIEFESNDGFLSGFHLVGFTICEDAKEGLFVLFPASIIGNVSEDSKRDNRSSKPFFFLRPSNDDDLGRLEHQILDVYESMTRFNQPTVKG